MTRRRRKKSQKNRNDQEKEDYEYRGLVSAETRKSIFIIILLVLALVSFLSLFDLAGALGQFIRQSLGAIFGWGLYLFPVIMLVLGYALLRPEKYDIKPSNCLGLIILFLSYSGLFQFFKDFNEPAVLAQAQGGGYLGFAVYYSLQKVMGSWAGLIILVALLFISLLVTFNTSLPALINKINVFGYLKKRVAKELDEEDEEAWEEEGEEKTSHGHGKHGGGHDKHDKEDGEFEEEEGEEEERSRILLPHAVRDESREAHDHESFKHVDETAG